MEFKKDDSGTIPESSDRSLAAGCFIKLSIKWGPVHTGLHSGKSFLPIPLFESNLYFVMCLKKTKFPHKYRFHILLGSIARRNSHSARAFLNSIGALGTFPAVKSKNAPTAITVRTSSLSRYSVIHFSCNGTPSPTINKSGLLLFIR